GEETGLAHGVPAAVGPRARGCEPGGPSSGWERFGWHWPTEGRKSLFSAASTSAAGSSVTIADKSSRWHDSNNKKQRWRQMKAIILPQERGRTSWPKKQ